MLYGKKSNDLYYYRNTELTRLMRSINQASDI